MHETGHNYGAALSFAAFEERFRERKLFFLEVLSFNLIYFGPNLQTITEKAERESFPPIAETSTAALHICTYQFTARCSDVRSSTGYKLKTLKFRNLTAVDMVREWEGAPPGLERASAAINRNVGNIGQTDTRE